MCKKKQRKTVTYSIVWVEDVGGWRVVHNDDFVEIPAQTAQVLDVISTVEHTRFSEKTASESSPLVQQIRDRIGILEKQNHINVMDTVRQRREKVPRINKKQINSFVKCKARTNEPMTTEIPCRIPEQATGLRNRHSFKQSHLIIFCYYIISGQ